MEWYKKGLKNLKKNNFQNNVGCNSELETISDSDG